MTQPAPHRLVFVGDDLLLSLADKDVVRAEFPFLESLRNLKKRCSCKGKTADRDVKIAAAKRSLAELPEAKKQVFKKMVNALRVGVRYEVGGKAVATEF